MVTRVITQFFFKKKTNLIIQNFVCNFPEFCFLPLTRDLILPGNEYVALMLLTSTTELLKATDLLESMGRQHRISNITIDMLYIADGQTDRTIKQYQTEVAQASS